MKNLSIPANRLVHENFSILMCFAYSQLALADMVNKHFDAGWKYLHKALFEVSAERAEKAAFELALYLRTLDDEYGLSDYDKATSNSFSCGSLVMANGTVKALPFREAANKIIHAKALRWQLKHGADPLLICLSRDDEKWDKAEIDLVGLSFVCGRIMS